MLGSADIEDPKLESKWTTVRSAIVNPEAVVKCSNCVKSTTIHPNYTKAGITACLPHCDTLEVVVKKMLELRRWTFDKIVRGKGPGQEATIFFSCNRSHYTSLCYGSLRKGASCKTCTKEPKPERERKTVTRAPCNCRGSNNKTRPPVCPHHNHLVCYPGSAKEWDYQKNGNVRPENISPNSSTDRWWKCLNDWCKMSYPQDPDNRGAYGYRCPFCSGNKVCEWNCLLTNCPDLCKELDPDNVVKPTEVTCGSSVKLTWICNKHGDEPFKYPATVIARVNSKSGCPKCNQNGYEQRVGGHDHFVKISREVHGDKYQYIEEYKGSQVHIQIYCPLIIKDSDPPEPHGIFMQTPDRHKVSIHGCPTCAAEEHDSEHVRQFQAILDMMGLKRNVDYIAEHPFDGLVYLKQLHVDRFIIKVTLVTELDGEQHFVAVKSRGGDAHLKISQERDLCKDRYCVRNKINFLRIPYNIVPSYELLSRIIILINSGYQVYASYDHYFQRIRDEVDMTGIYYIDMLVKF
jgi:hypothetical protein